MKRKLWFAVVSLILILTFLVCYFNYDKTPKEIEGGTFVSRPALEGAGLL